MSEIIAPPPLNSFGSGLAVAVVGASGGIGGALLAALEAAPAATQVFAFSRAQIVPASPKTTWQALDLEDEDSIARSAETVTSTTAALHLAIVATGVLHAGDSLQPEKTWRSLNAVSLQHAFAVNATGPALIAKHFLPLLARDRKAVFAALSARVGSIGDNQLGGWYAYRASKAALNMLIRTYSVELGRRNAQALCVGLHPGTVDSSLSRPFQGGVPDGKLFSPAQAAGQLLEVLDGLSPDDSGALFAWDGQRISF